MFNIADAIFLLNALFAGGMPPSCVDACDANDDGSLNIGDGVYTLNNLFAKGPPPPAPFPGCGVDPTGDPLGCANYSECARP